MLTIMRIRKIRNWDIFPLGGCDHRFCDQSTLHNCDYSILLERAPFWSVRAEVKVGAERGTLQSENRA
jgi:hypothetical protein